MDVLSRPEVIAELSRFYDAAEVAEILATADSCGIFADELGWQGSNLKVSVRAHQMSVNEPVSYTIVWS